MILKCKHIVLSALLLFIGFAAGAQSERAQINPFSQELLIGEQTRVELNVTAGANETIIWPEFTDTITSQIEIVESSPIDTIFEDSVTKQNIIGFQKQWVITSFDSGLWAFPETTVWIDSIPFTTHPFLLAVNTIDVDTAKGFVDIVAPIELPMTFWEYVQAYYHYPLIGIAILFVLAIVAYLIGKDGKTESVSEPKEIIPAHITALERLDKLKAAELWQQGKPKEYHIQISDIVRGYIEDRYKIPVLESTTDEIKHLLKGVRMEKSIRKEVIESLRLSDLVKFAKANPLPHENEDCLTLAYKLVDQTKIVEPPQNNSDAE